MSILLIWNEDKAAVGSINQNVNYYLMTGSLGFCVGANNVMPNLLGFALVVSRGWVIFLTKLFFYFKNFSFQKMKYAFLYELLIQYSCSLETQVMRMMPNFRWPYFNQMWLNLITYIIILLVWGWPTQNLLLSNESECLSSD